MTNLCIRSIRLVAGLLGILDLAEVAQAQFFTATKGDLLLGFRKPGVGSYELVVNLGSVTNLLAVSPGVSIPVGNFSSAQLSAAFSTYDSLQWSVCSAFAGSSAWSAFPASTIWSTVARPSANTQSQAPARASSSAQQQAKTRIYGVGAGATTISTGLGTTNSNNDLAVVREPAGDGSALTAYIGDPSDATLGDFQGAWYNVENITPASFTAAQRSDLYQSCPTGTADPKTGLTVGNAYYVGYFEFDPSGAMTFTRASGLPPAPLLSVQRAGDTSTVSFATTSGATYWLHFTNSAGFATPISAWPTLPGTVVGDGQIHSFQDTSSDPDRVYAVGAQ